MDRVCGGCFDSHLLHVSFANARFGLKRPKRTRTSNHSDGGLPPFAMEQNYLKDIEYEDETPIGVRGETNAPQAATGEIEFIAPSVSGDPSAGFGFFGRRSYNGFAQINEERHRVKTSIGAFALDVDRKDLPNAIAALLEAVPAAQLDLATSAEPRVRETLASFENLDPSVVERLAWDESEAVRRQLLENADALSRMQAETLEVLRSSLR